ncbi:MAG: polyphosphate kinase 1 [Planctomycetes bacterium]|nr:polyphosphate kinase 1 [Planctomycetota bacterium]
MIPKAAEIDARSQNLYFNRELSLLEFQWRVLSLARDSDMPLLERLRFLTISVSNLDEFFEIRVSGLKQHMAFDVGLSSPDDLTVQEVFRKVNAAAHALVKEQYRVLNEELLPAMEKEGIRLLRRGTWPEEEARWVADYFEKEVLPVLTPVGLDPAHPFPRIVNKSLNFIVSLRGKDAFGRSSGAAVVQAPRLLPRLIPVPRNIAKSPHEFVLLSSVIHENVAKLFPGMTVEGCYQFRVTRDSDLWIDEEEVDDLSSALKGELLSRRFGAATRLEVADTCSEEMQDFLLEQFHLERDDLFKVNGQVNLNRLSALYDLVDRPDLKYRPFVPATPAPLTQGTNIFDLIREGDILLHHPYQSLVPVVELLREAARDPQVLAIKQTVYRTGPESPLMDALVEAARAGKEVTAVVELRARFEEAANIDLATRLQDAGARVSYGIVGYKAHAKMLLVVRRDGNVLRRYVHIGTGNYHVGTTRAYTDFGLLTCNEEIGEDVHNLFQQLTGLGKVSRLNRLLQSPFTLHSTLLNYIENETAAAQAGRKAQITAKLNALIEPQIIRALYRASQAGVKIDLIVRGICCLRPRVPGLSDNISVRSVVGRFLEHSRIYYFFAEGKELTLCSSADWMDRNFFRRFEVCFPIDNKRLKKRVIDEGLKPYLDDNTQTWELQPDGSYQRFAADGAPPMNAQGFLLKSLTESP